MNAAVVIQARMASSRLPGKVLRPILGRPMIERIRDQALAAKLVSCGVLSTSNEQSDDDLVDFAQKLGLQVSRGIVDDIVGRLHKAAVLVKADYIVRVWGDCPFICPDVIDLMLTKARVESLDYLTNGDVTDRGVPAGLDCEIYAAPLLTAMTAEVSDPKHREFPIEYVKKNRSKLRSAIFKLEGAPVHLHLTVDYPQDLEAANEIYRRLASLPFNSTDLFATLSADSKLPTLFADSERNIEYFQYLASQKGN